MMPVKGTSKPVPFLRFYVEYIPTNQPGRLLFNCFAMSQVLTGPTYELSASQYTIANIIQMLI